MSQPQGYAGSIPAPGTNILTAISVVTIATLKTSDIKEVSDFMRGIVGKTMQYSAAARKAEMEKFSPAALRRSVRDRDVLILVAKVAGKVVGALVGRYDAGTFWSDWLVVHPRERRSGIGEALSRTLGATVAKKGIRKVWCDSRTNNKKSIALLTKLKFKRIATIKDHWYGQDYILWQRFLR